MVKRAAGGLIIALVIAASACSAAPPAELLLDSQIKSMSKAGVGPVKYPHARHEKLYKCADCHPKIFKEKRGESGINMKGNMEQKFCGSPNCHNSPKSFPLYQCARCHTNVKGAKK
ncbi:MAG: hypothetical protein HZB83_09220 [Deltaproteobacteria bacterium]|nr:hypothetical protein [Deltaproteobacteria bacterium]